MSRDAVQLGIVWRVLEPAMNPVILTAMDSAPFDRVPHAQVVRYGKLSVPPLRRHVGPALERGRLGPAVNTALSYVLGLWPLTAVVLLAAALLWSAGFHNSP
jgi:hypothetical protein